MAIRASKDLYAGGIFFLFGAGFAWLARDYPMGRLARMGPAYFPTVLGVTLAIMGLLVALRAVLTDKEAPSARLFLRPLLLVLAGVCLFAALIGPFGLVASIGGLIFLSAMGGQEFRVRDSLLLWAGLSILSVAVFVFGLHLQFKVWPL